MSEVERGPCQDSARHRSGGSLTFHKHYTKSMAQKEVKLEKPISEMEMLTKTKMVRLKCRAKQIIFFSSFPLDQLSLDNVSL